MQGRSLAVLLLPVCVVLAVQQVSVEAKQPDDDTEHIVRLANTHGKSGVRCTRTGLQCVSGRRCVRRQCRCPRGQCGNAQFECTQRREKVCFITGDTSVTGYGKANAPVTIPCTYRASRFITDGKTTFSSCSIEIHVTNEAWRDIYRARAVHVTVGVSEPFEQRHTTAQTTVIGSFGTNGTNDYNYEVRAKPTRLSVWGSGPGEATGREDVIHTTVDDINNFVIMNLQQCGVRIKFRGYDNTKPSQDLLPGVSVVVPEGATFINQLGNYPYSLCGRSSDRQTLYRGRARSEGLGDTSITILADILQQQPPQFDNPMAEQCEAAMSLYASSRDQKADMKACGFLLTRKATRGCLNHENFLPIDVFNACLKVRQQPDEVEACSLLQNAVAQCGHQWRGTQVFCGA